MQIPNELDGGRELRFEVLLHANPSGLGGYIKDLKAEKQKLPKDGQGIYVHDTPVVRLISDIGLSVPDMITDPVARVRDDPHIVGELGLLAVTFKSVQVSHDRNFRRGSISLLPDEPGCRLLATRRSRLLGRIGSALGVPLDLPDRDPDLVVALARHGSIRLDDLSQNAPPRLPLEVPLIPELTMVSPRPDECFTITHDR